MAAVTVASDGAGAGKKAFQVIDDTMLLVRVMRSDTLFLGSFRSARIRRGALVEPSRTPSTVRLARR